MFEDVRDGGMLWEGLIFKAGTGETDWEVRGCVKGFRLCGGAAMFRGRGILEFALYSCWLWRIECLFCGVSFFCL